MKAEYIVLRTNQGNTRDVFTGAATGRDGGYPLAPDPASAQDFLRNIGNLAASPNDLFGSGGRSGRLIGAPAGSAIGAESAFLPTPALTPFMAAPVPAVKIEVKTLERNALPYVSSAADVLAVAESVPISLLKEVHDMSGAVAVPLALGHASWGVQAVRADTSPYDGRGIVVAVLDTGIDRTHPAFAGIELIEEDFTDEGNGDVLGHGTHCAGTIFGRAGPFGRIGIAPGVQRALIGKIIGSKGGGTSARLAKAMEWAAENGANVISMSVGIDFTALAKRMEDRLPERVAMSRALEAYRATVRLFETVTLSIKAKSVFGSPSIFIAAAGNDTDRTAGPEYELSVTPPANSEGFMSVGAVGHAEGNTSRMAVARFSNTGPNICAPGVDIVSARPGGDLVAMSGTSMAAPHVAGVAALWAEKLKRQGQLNAMLLSANLFASASTAVFVPGFDLYDTGAGMVQAPQV
ncbi:S8 family serine peptidase [Massilia sp. H6]|uniref:S8 family peptidase n=1 Tax=Massilia sp. H6 TaxID=2970464 RepID=UPI002167E3D2|nr:S8 family serine peptidase [Massilia sp. H6]UVW29572.1 S8 family serine peptidase [Massilia sp. H6]